LAKICSNHDLVLVVSLARRTIQDAEKFEQWVDLLHLFQTPNVRVPPSDRADLSVFAQPLGRPPSFPGACIDVQDPGY
nr:hypothetical protein [Tanacetum cinerariifolium]